MSNDEHHKWGPWIDHDGKGCPVPKGTVCQVVWVDGDYIIEPIKGSFAWWWASLDRDGWSNGFIPITRYRIRKPRGMKMLEGLLQNLHQDAGNVCHVRTKK